MQCADSKSEVKIHLGRLNLKLKVKYSLATTW